MGQINLTQWSHVFGKDSTTLHSQYTRYWKGLTLEDKKSVIHTLLIYEQHAVKSLTAVFSMAEVNFSKFIDLI